MKLFLTLCTIFTLSYAYKPTLVDIEPMVDCSLGKYQEIDICGEGTEWNNDMKKCTIKPTQSPTNSPTESPTHAPTKEPTTHSPTKEPTTKEPTTKEPTK